MGDSGPGTREKKVNFEEAKEVKVSHKGGGREGGGTRTGLHCGKSCQLLVEPGLHSIPEFSSVVCSVPGYPAASCAEWLYLNATALAQG